MEDSSHTLAGLGKNAKDIVEVVPQYLRLIESFHSVGLMVPWDDLEIADDRKFRIVSRSASFGVSWVPFVNYETREDLLSRSPKHDLLQLTKWMSSLGAIPDLPEWKKTLESFQRQVDFLSQHESPKYSNWIRRFSELEIVCVRDRFAALSADDITKACQMSKENWGRGLGVYRRQVREIFGKPLWVRNWSQ